MRSLARIVAVHKDSKHRPTNSNQKASKSNNHDYHYNWRLLGKPIMAPESLPSR